MASICTCKGYQITCVHTPLNWLPFVIVAILLETSDHHSLPSDLRTNQCGCGRLSWLQVYVYTFLSRSAWMSWNRSLSTKTVFSCSSNAFSFSWSFFFLLSSNPSISCTALNCPANNCSPSFSPFSLSFKSFSLANSFSDWLY